MSVGPDSFGYVATARTLQAIDLVPGAPGVVTAIDAADNASAFIPLGANTFNLYGVTYSGASALSVSSNGLITFGAGVSSADNSNLISGPAQAAIAPLWDDWTTNFVTSAAGASNDAVLYQFDAPNNRLIIEWNHVRRFGFTAFGDVTFSAVLGLNTGALPGTITFNYPDITIGHAWYDEGADATVGIKPSGAPPLTQLVVGYNSATTGLIASGSAVDVAWAPSTISGRTFQDNNGDGLYSAGEPGLAGATVYIDSNANGTLNVGEATAVSGAGGSYAFANLAAGTYRLVQVPLAGQITPAPQDITTLPAQGATVDFANIPTYFGGTGAADHYLLRRDVSGTKYEVLVEDVPTYLLASSVVAGLDFELGGGDDSLTVDYVNGSPLNALNVWFDGGNHSVAGGDGLVINGSAGDDNLLFAGIGPLTFANVERVTVNGNGGNDVLTISTDEPIAVTLDGGAGNDSLLYDATESADLIDVATTTILGGGHSARFFSTELISIFGLGGSDIVRVNSTAPGMTVSVVGGGGDDDVTIGAGVLDAVPGSVSVFGNTGEDAITLEDALSSNNYQYVFNGNTFDRDFFGALSWFAVESITLNEAGGNNAATVQAPAGFAAGGAADQVMPQLTVNGNSGDDVLNISGENAPQVIFNGGTSAGDHDVLNVLSGTYTFLQNASVGSANLTVNVSASGEVMFFGSQRLTALNVTGRAIMAPHGDRYLHAASLSLAAGAELDLADNDLILDSADFATIRALTFAGFGNTTGITSSTSTGAQILALFDNSLIGATEWLGQPLSPTAIVGKYTYFGDMNFDGQVTGDDYTVIDANLGLSPPPWGLAWLSGDANLDGIITGDDCTVIDANLGLGVGQPL